MLVPGVVGEPSIQWTKQDGTVVNASTGNTLSLNFNPLSASNSSLYTCKASLTIGNIMPVAAEATKEVLLESELHHAVNMFSAKTLPALPSGKACFHNSVKTVSLSQANISSWD